MYKQVDWWNMKIHATNSYLKSGYHSHPSEHKAGLYENNMTQGYNVGFSGSVAQESGEAAAKGLKKLGNTVWDKILSSKLFGKIADIAEEKSVVMQALVSLVVAGVLRPATNMAIASKEDREDAMYAASHAISSAVIGFLVSYTVMKPFDDAFKKFKNEPEKYIKKGMEKVFNVDKISQRRLAQSNSYKNITKALQMIPDALVLGIPKAMLTIALIPPILKYVFGWEKKSNGQPVNASLKDNVKDYVKYNTAVGLGIMTMEAFLGGKK